jgi:hypothetical protein
MKKTTMHNDRWLSKFAAVTVGLLLIVSNAAAGEHGISLLARDSLIGWDAAAAAPAGWTIANGVLSGDANAERLTAGWTLGDFELHVRWSVADGGQIKFTLPTTPPIVGRIADRYIEPRLYLLLCEGNECGQLYDGERLLAMVERAVAHSEEHAVVIARRGDQLSLAIDDQPAYTVAVTPARLGMMLSVPVGKAALRELRLIEPAGAPLFNGKNLEGWETNDPAGAWIVEDEQIVCTGKGGDYLRTQREFANFTLSLEYNLSRRGNSGIGIRTPPGGWPSGDGMELQLYDERPDTPLNRHSTMALYGNLEPLARAEKPGEWNQAVVRAEGYMISAWINGELVQHANTWRLPELKHRHLSGWIGLQNHHSPIRFRNVQLLESPAGLGPPAWRAQRTESAAQIVLDRLMNSERLARRDDIAAGTAASQLKQAGKQVIAELKGPGAVVEVAAIFDQSGADASEAAFYFDGEAEPRLRCRLNELEHHAPPMSEGGLPTQTFLTYRDSLKVVVDAQSAGRCRVDYVSLPAELVIDSFRTPTSGIDRGLLPAISYRHDQMDGGRHRERDPYALLTAKPVTVMPGQRVELLSIDGAGLVDWWKLIVPPAALANDDLTLAVVVDGQSEPAIAAPARLLFPGLAQGRDWHNFVLVNSEGATLRLAMPFAEGLKIVAHNVGSVPIAGVGATASVIGLEQLRRPITEYGRLRGVYTSHFKSAVAIPGAGRLAGLICAAPSGRDATIEWKLDGASQPVMPLDIYLGVRLAREARSSLAGTAGGVAWRYPLLAPPRWNSAAEMRLSGDAAPKQALLLYYTQP